MPERKAAGRRQARVRENLHLLPKDAQEAILESFENDKQESDKESNRQHGTQDYDEADTASIPARSQY